MSLKTSSSSRTRKTPPTSNETSYQLKRQKSTISSPVEPILISLPPRIPITIEIETSPRKNELSLLQKSKAIVAFSEGKNSKQISKEIKSDKRVVRRLLFKAKNECILDSNHKGKGRWKKGETKLNLKQKMFIQKWLSSGEVNSSKQAWSRLTRIKNLPRVSLSCVNSYIKTLGAFVKPTLKTEVSQKNRIKRLNYCETHKDFDFRNVLFTDESSFQLNSNTIKVFHLKGEKKPHLKKLNPNHKVMIWGGISWTGKTDLFVISGKFKGKLFYFF